MPYKVSIKEKPDHIRVKVTGKDDKGNALEDSLNVWKQVADFCRKSRMKGVFHILAVWDITGEIPTYAAFEIGDNAMKIGEGLRFKLAVVQLQKERLQHSQLAVLVAGNRGAHLKLFENEKEAKKWLLG